MKQDWKDQMSNISNALKLKCCRQKDLKASEPGDHTLSQELHKTSWKHHCWNPCRKAPQKHVWYVSIWICKGSCKFNWSSGAECKIAPHEFWKRFRWWNHHHHATPCVKLPKNHIWHGQFKIWTTWQKSKKRKRGLFAKWPHFNS